MKTTFFHDTIFIEYNGNYYTKDGLNQEALGEYMQQFGDLTIVSRLEGLNDSNKKYINEKNRILNIKFVGVKHRYANAIEQVKSAMKETEVAIVRLPSFIGNIAVYYARKFHKKYFIEYVGSAFSTLWYHSFTGRIIAPLISIINKIEIKNAPYVLYVTNKYLQSRYKTKGEYISCSDVKLDKIDKQKLKRRLEKIENKAKDEKVILGTLAAIHIRYKGHRFVLKAMSDLKKQGYTNIEYQVVGSGKQDYLRKIAHKYKVADCLTFIGQLPHDDVFNWLEKLDIYIQPSETEGLSRAIIEAMSVSCPIIASSAGGNSELINSNYIFKNRNVRQLEEKIKNMINNKEIMKNSARENFQNATQYDKEILRLKREEFYKKIKNDI